VSGDETVPQVPTNLSSVPISVEIGGVAANVLYHGRTQFPGLDQINAVVPSGITFGCNVPVVVKSGAFSSNNTTIPVSSSGGTCPATGGGGSSGGGGGDGGGIDISQAEIDRWLASGQFRVGGLALTRSTSISITDSPMGGASTTQVRKSDDFTATFFRIAGADLSRMFNSQYVVPTAGACTITQSVTNPFPNLTYTSLNAGPSVGVTGPRGSRTAERKTNSTGMIVYEPAAGMPDPDTYIDPGRYTFTGPGGPDVGAFSGSMTVAPELVWTNVSDLTVVNRNTPLTVTWSGGEPSALVTIQGQSFVAGASGTVTGAAFTCFARNTDRTFTVPTSILGQLPASAKIAAGPISITMRGSLAVASTGTGTRLQANGLDYLTAGNQWGIAQTTEYR
jgi:hypothetical protein